MNILDLILQDYDLSDSEVYLLQFLLDHSSTIVSYSSHQFAKETFTSPTSIIRFIKKLNFHDYNDFKLHIHTFLEKYYLQTLNFHDQDSLSSTKNKMRYIQNQIIIQTDNLLTEKKLQYAKDLLKAPIIHIYANDTNAQIAKYAMHIFSSLGKVAYVFENSDLQLYNALHITQNICPILITKYGLNPNLTQVVQILNQKKMHFITITAKNENPIANKSSFCLYGILHNDFENLRDMIFYASLKYIFDILYALLLTDDFQKMKEYDLIYDHYFKR